jgi:hypothetical protein
VTVTVGSVGVSGRHHSIRPGGIRRYCYSHRKRNIEWGALKMPGDDRYGFFVQLYEDVNGVPKFTGVIFESEVLGSEVPRVGDCIISPLRKADFDARNPASHYVFEIGRRYFLPDVTREQASIVKLLAKRRALTADEQHLFSVK